MFKFSRLAYTIPIFIHPIIHKTKLLDDLGIGRGWYLTHEEFPLGWGTACPSACTVGHRLGTFASILHSLGHPRNVLVLTRISHMVNAKERHM